jgi:two-component system, NtrC family, sensor histidine kinase PilS
MCVAYFTFALVCITPIQRRWPATQWMALFPLAVDGVVITLLIHASGGVGSGLATLLFLPVGATATVVRPRLALLATAIITIGTPRRDHRYRRSSAHRGSDFLVPG